MGIKEQVAAVLEGLKKSVGEALVKAIVPQLKPLMKVQLHALAAHFEEAAKKTPGVWDDILAKSIDDKIDQLVDAIHLPGEA